MSTIPSVFNARQIQYTVVGGKRITQASADALPVSAILLNRGGRYYRGVILDELRKVGFGSIVSIEGAQDRWDVEALSLRFPEVRFIILHEAVTPGEMVNLGLQETQTAFALVLWNDLRFSSGSISSRFFDRLKDHDSLCTVPSLLGPKGEAVPSIQVPAFYRKALKVLSLPPARDGAMTLFPFDYVGIYSRERFILTGGYDYTITNPYWQKLDFGFRSYMWGETMHCAPSLRLAYDESPGPENTTPDESYKRFYLKNLTVAFRGDSGFLPYRHALSYMMKIGTNPFAAFGEYREARRWAELNRYRFRNDARGITELWRVEEE
jgi:hypothetical protein